MIGAGHASPAVRPFYRRAAGPTESIVRTFLDSDSDNQALGIANLTMTGLNLGSADTLLLALAYNNFADVDALAIDLDGTAVSAVAGRSFGTSSRVNTYRLGMNGTPVAGGTLTIDYSLSTGEPTLSCAIAIKVSGLLQPNSQDRTKTNNGTGFNQDSGLTALATIQAHEFIWGIIGRSDISTSPPGNWTAPLQQGARVSAPTLGAMDLMEGYAVVNAIAQYRAQINAAVSVAWGATCQTFKGA